MSIPATSANAYQFSTPEQDANRVYALLKMYEKEWTIEGLRIKARLHNKQINQPGVFTTPRQAGVIAIGVHLGTMGERAQDTAKMVLWHVFDWLALYIPASVIHWGSTAPALGGTDVMPTLEITVAYLNDLEREVRKAHRAPAPAPAPAPVPPTAEPSVIPTAFDWKGAILAALNRFEANKRDFTLTRRAADLVHDLTRLAGNEPGQ